MQDLNEFKKKVASMAALTLNMWQTTHQAFMEHSLELLTQVLKKENKLNALEKELVSGLVTSAQTLTDKGQKAEALVYTDVVGDLELIGDYCKDILERLQIKIEEKLLFSEEAVEEYEELSRRTECALKEVVSALEKEDLSRIEKVANKEGHIDALVDKYRQRHNQRMIEGVCSPMACNMFLNIIDFTAAVYYHVKKIARNLLKLKKNK